MKFKLRHYPLIGDLLAGFELFLRFAREVGAIDDAGRADLNRGCRAALLELGKQQADHQAASDPCDRFLTLLASALGSGRAHVAGIDDEHPKANPYAWGWRLAPAQPTRPDAPLTWLPQGRRLGWVDDDDLYLDPDSAYAEVQRFGNEQGDCLTVGRDTLHKRLRERGLLAGVDEKRGKLLVRRTVGEGRRYVLHLPTSVLYAETEGPMGPPGPTDVESREKEPASWAHSEPDPENRPTRNGPTADPCYLGENGGVGPIGPSEFGDKAHPAEDVQAHDAPPPSTRDVEVEWSA